MDFAIEFGCQRRHRRRACNKKWQGEQPKKPNSRQQAQAVIRNQFLENGERRRSSPPNTKFMKTTSSSKQVPIGATDRACKLLIAAMSAIETHELRKIPQTEFSRLLGVSRPTLINWSSRSTQSFQLEALLQLLERLPEDLWHHLLKRFLRICPAIDSPMLAHEPATVTQLRLLLRQKRGVTLIQGGSDTARTIVFTAIGRTASLMSGPKVTISGIDLHIPDWFVPVDTLTYISPSTDRAGLASEIKREWKGANQGRWRMFNGVWSVLPEYQHEILTVAQNQHIVVADAVVQPAAQLRKIAAERRLAVRLLNVSVPQADRINVEFHIL